MARARVLIIDDDRIIRKIVEANLAKLGFEVISASNGMEGLQKVKTDKPDVVVTDKMMPEMDGLEVTRRLRRQPETAHIPILVLTGESELEDKVAAFEAGADDHLGKPFEAAELAVRIMALMRQVEALKAAKAQAVPQPEPEAAKLIVIHSLRGGIGCSSIAVNLALALHALWQKPTLLADMVLTAGQIALMLNSPAKHTWADLGDYEADELDGEAINSIIGNHDSGLHFIAAPANPANAEQVTTELVNKSVELLIPRYQYIVADLSHDFSNISLDLLDNADEILLLLAPEMASVRTAAIALDTYSRLGYDREFIKLLLNWTFERDGLPSKKIESALNHPISLVMPYAPKQFVGAINRGIPLIYGHPENAVSALIEDFAFRLSKEKHQNTPPESPSASWQRLNDRLNMFGDKPKRRSSLLSFA